MSRIRSSLLLFIIINAVIWAFTVDGAALKYGSDVGTWYLPALGLLKYGGFVDPNNPSVFLTTRPPIYPMMIAALDACVSAVIIVQLVLLFATGFIARAIGKSWLVFWLTIFNPNAIGNAHIIGSDTLYAFVFLCLVWCVLEFCRNLTWQYACLVGVLFGLSLLVRNPLEAMLPILPFGMMGFAVIQHGAMVWKRGLFLGCLAVVTAFAVVSPWWIYNYDAGEGFGETTTYQKFWFLKTELAALDNCRLGTLDNRIIPANYDQAWAQLKNYSVGDYACALKTSFVLMAVTPGTSNFQQLFGLTAQSDLTLLRTNRFRDFAAKVSVPAIAITAFGLLFVLAIRGFGFLGIAAMIERRKFALLTLTLCAALYMTLIVGFGGVARYRLPVDPLLFILASFGFYKAKELSWLKAIAFSTSSAALLPWSGPSASTRKTRTSVTSAPA